MIRRAARAFLVAVIAAAALALLPGTASAQFHLMLVTEVFPGAKDSPGAQYVELQMHFPFQTMVQGHLVEFYDEKGKKTGSFEFTEALANGVYGDFVLIATEEAEEYFGVEADLLMEPVMKGPAGMACWENIDCVSWGKYKGSKTKPSPSGTPFGGKKGIPADQAIERDVEGGMIPALIDPMDDTNDSAADFFLADPNPANNARQTGSPP
jgi:hypothetical protein